MDTSPFQPPTTELLLPVNRTVPIRTTALALFFAASFVTVSVGNHFAIFWGTNGFEYWQLRRHLSASLFFESMLFALAVILAPIAAWRYSRISPNDRSGLVGMVISPALLVAFTFGILRQRGLPDEKLLILLSVILVALQVFAVAYICRRMFGGLRVAAVLTFICGTAGVSAGVFHIVINSLVT